MFLTLEDELGMTNIVLRPQWAAMAKAQLQYSDIMEVEGIAQRDAGALTLMGARVVARRRDTSAIRSELATITLRKP